MQEKIYDFKKKLFKHIGYVPHQGQIQLHFPDKPARFTVGICGRRWGKSTAAGVEALTLLMQPDKRIWNVAPSYTLAEKVFREVWHYAMNVLQIPTKRASYRNMVIQTDWDSVFEGKSEDNQSSLVGEGLDLLISDETAKQRKNSYDMYLRPTLSDRKGNYLGITTPQGYNWVYDQFMLGQADPEWTSFNSPSWDNHYAYPLGANDPDLLEAKRNMAIEIFDQEYGAKFTSMAGRVYPFDRLLDMGDYRYNPRYPTYCSIDFGYRMPAAAWFQTYMVDGMWHVNVIDEFIHKTLISTDDLLDAVKDKARTYNVSQHFGDPAGAGDIETFRRAGIRVRCVKDKISRKLTHGISHVRSFVKNGEGKRFLHLDHKCKGLAEDLESYRYPEHKEGYKLNEDPVKDGYHDHGCDMMRYFFLNRFPIRQQGIKRIQRG